MHSLAASYLCSHQLRPRNTILPIIDYLQTTLTRAHRHITGKLDENSTEIHRERIESSCQLQILIGKVFNGAILTHNIGLK